MKTKAPGRNERCGIRMIDLFRMFPDEYAARIWFESVRWKDGRFCPICGSEDTHHNPTEKPLPYHCRSCRSFFSVKSGTVMHKSKIELHKWAIAIYLMSTNLKGVSSMKLHRELGITQKSAWGMARKIRQGWDRGRKRHGYDERDTTGVDTRRSDKWRDRLYR